MLSTSLVMYLCLVGTNGNCESQEVWLAGRWEGSNALQECTTAKAQAEQEVAEKAHRKETIRFQCESDVIASN